MFEKSDLAREFSERFQGDPQFFRAPGRVNLIGEHTDYNDGFVMPAALHYEAKTACAAREDSLLRVHALNLNEFVEFDLKTEKPEPRGDWSDYVIGVAVKLLEAGYQLKGADIVLGSTVPVGSGLSSSAALEVVIGYSLLSLAGETVDLVRLAQLCQKAENEFVGMNCGIMDQFISCCGQDGHALQIDCRSLEKTLVQLPQDVRIVVSNSMVSHSLADGEYNKRRQSCTEGVEILSSVLKGITALRDVSLDELGQHKDLLSAQTYNRCLHIVTENQRVLDAQAALKAGDAARFGALMNASHTSMRDLYEISCKEVDVLVELALGLPGVLGSRMTGGGFGGCTVSLVKAGYEEAFMADLAKAYEKATGLISQVFACTPHAGAGPL